MFNDYYQYPRQIHLKHSLQNSSELMMLIFTRVLSFSFYNTVFLYPFCQVHVLILLLVKYSYQYQNLILLKTSNKNSFTMDSYEVKDFFSNYKVEDYYHWNLREMISLRELYSSFLVLFSYYPILKCIFYKRY